MSDPKLKMFGVTVVHTEYLYVYAEDASKDSLLDAIVAGNFEEVTTEKTNIANVHFIKDIP